MKTKIMVGVVLFFGQISCSDDATNFDLKGTWIDSGSLGLQFIEFSSDNQGRFGFYNKDVERYEDFTYRLIDTKIAIDFAGDDEGETLYDFSFTNSNQIEIFGLTVVSENESKTYLRSNIKTQKANNEIILGKNDLYFDFEKGYRLQAYCSDDARCPTDVQCVWEGIATVRFNLIVDGNQKHTFDLFTRTGVPRYKSDTTINGLSYKVIAVTPSRSTTSNYTPEDYTVIVSVE